jgi:conjugal transfer mating pair stabilization protein TraN
LTVLQVWVPAALLYLTAPQLARAQADPFMDAARQGQSFGQNILPNASGLAGQDPNGNIQLNWQGNTTTFDPKQLFPDTKNTTDPGAKSSFGSHAGVINQGQNEVQVMSGSQSQTGDAYRALQNSVNRARVDMSNSNMWLQTDQALADIFADAPNSNCQPVTTVDPKTNYIHSPDYRTCERIVFPGNTCKCRHDYVVKNLGQFTAGFYLGAYQSTISFTVNLQQGSCDNCASNGYNYNFTLNEPLPPDVCENPNSVIIKMATNSMQQFAAIVNMESGCTFKIDAHFSGTWDEFELGYYSITFYILQIIDRGWTCDPGCEVLLTNPDGDSFIHPTSFACTFGCNNDCADIAGATICQADLTSANPFAAKAISNLCQEVTINLDGTNLNSGQMNCWTDTQGVQHCPENPGDLKDTCAVLEQNPACTFVSQDCIKGAKDPISGFCYAYNVVFDCGLDIPASGTQTTMAYICNGVIKCMGESCIQGQFDPNNTGFAKSAAALQMAQYAQQDMNCGSAEALGCVLFQGTFMECKKALGGYIDCCTEPEGVSLVEYINLLTVVQRLGSIQWELDGVFPAMFANNPLNGVWTTLRSPYDFFKDLLSSAWDNLIAENLPDITMSGMQEVISQHLMEAAYELINSMSPELAEAMFVTGFGDVGTILLSESMQMLVGLVQFAMWIYTLYQLFDILVHIIWQCTQEEFELGAKRQLKVCHYNGSYCQGKILGICIEKRDSYCCYNSPLARILQEQVRKQPQVNRPYGEADSPDCSGLTAVDLQVVNWDLVDLSEWMGLLMLAGKLPTQKEMSIEGLTGAGSPWNFEKTSEPRPNLTERTLERLNFTSEDLEQLRITKELMMWGVGQGQ